MRLGEMLVKQGWISRQDLARALDRQRTSRQRLGEILVEMGRISDGQLQQTLQEQAASREQPANTSADNSNAPS